MRSLVRRLTATVGALVLLVGAVALTVLAIPLAQYDDGRGSAAVEAELVSVVRRETDLASAVSVDLEWSQPKEVRSASEGLVSAVLARPTEVVECGSVVLEVQSRPIVAYCGPRPLSGDVTQRSVGADSEEFMDFLSSQGFFAEGTKDLSISARRDAIRWWQGVVGAEIDGIVSPSDLLWIGESFAPTSIAVGPGELLQLGDIVLSLEEHLVAATTDLSRAGFPAGEPLLFGIDGSLDRVTLAQSGSISDVDALEKSIRAQGLLREGLPPDVLGTARLARAAELVTVPATSIISTGDEICVMVVDETTSKRSAVGVEVVASLVGTVFVRSSLAPGQQVISNPDRAGPC